MLLVNHVRNVYSLAGSHNQCEQFKEHKVAISPSFGLLESQASHVSMLAQRSPGCNAFGMMP